MNWDLTVPTGHQVSSSNHNAAGYQRAMSATKTRLHIVAHGTIVWFSCIHGLGHYAYVTHMLL
jgi:hypothetical protein